MIGFEELIERLGYKGSSHYYSLDNPPPNDETAHIFRAARNIGVQGIYVFEASPYTESGKILPAYPAVYVAEANTVDEAREIHRKLWNLSHAPFIIILLPHQFRVYTGFNYPVDLSEEVGRLRLESLNALFDNFNADSVNTGRVWDKYSEALDTNNRVDKRLLKNLEQLGKELRKDDLSDAVAHTLIGKYIYLRYLRDREILTDQWLRDHNIKPDDVFSLQATVKGLQCLVETLEARVNGKIFPLDFQKETRLQDKHVALVASIFRGSELVSREAPDIVQQLHLDFRAYAFEYIPIETLSTIYEQFIHAIAKERKKRGVVYTPEVLADYLLSEVEWAKPLEQGMKIFDPACGSGVFLVLAYRRLIEKELRQRELEKLPPEELCAILLESIYGVEREKEACYVTELSLILTLLHYAEPHYLHKLEFQFPALHNHRIFHSDFFDLEGKKSKIPFWKLGLKFDLIIGNPPWIKPSAEDDGFARAWIQNIGNQTEIAIGDNSVAEAFSWLVTDLLTPDGLVGLIMPATSLMNLKSQKYRQAFFSKHEVLRITNFANLRDVLFESATLPAATIVYRQLTDNYHQSAIIHYAPFRVNQITTSGRDKPWVITINEGDIQTISHADAQKGKTSIWKIALWGSHLDKRALERLACEFPHTLGELCQVRNWQFARNVELINVNKNGVAGKLEKIPELIEKKRFQANLMSNSIYRFSIPGYVLSEITAEWCYVRARGGKLGLDITASPHIILSADVWGNYIVYSDEDFVVTRGFGIAGPEIDKDYLQALCIYLNSSLVAYFLFFQVPQWGVFRQSKQVSKDQVANIPVPRFSSEQIHKLASLWRRVEGTEKQEIHRILTASQQNTASLLSIDDTQNIQCDSLYPEQLTQLQRQNIDGLHNNLQDEIDEILFETLNIPEDIRILVEDFVQIKLPLDKISDRTMAVEIPSEQDLLIYARQLQTELDGFLRGSAYHNVTITKSDDLIECALEIVQTTKPCSITENNIQEGNLTTAELLMSLDKKLQTRFSQWVYVQRGLRLFGDSRIYLYKSPRLLDWTRTQAMLDAADIIGELITEGLK